MKLILNADDFGLTESVNDAIVDCFQAGIVKSTTIMMNQPGTQHGIGLYHQGLVDEVGLHFTVTAGKPISDPEQVTSLVNEEGYFFSRSQLYQKKDISEQHVYHELNAQYLAAMDAGLKINHLDSHHFGGVFPALKPAFIRFANEVHLPVRRIDNIISGQQMLDVRTPDVFDMSFFDKGVSLEHLQTILSRYASERPNQTVELMCHPANRVTKELSALSGYQEKRIKEWEILTSQALKEWLISHNIECVGFDHLHG